MRPANAMRPTPHTVASQDVIASMRRHGIRFTAGNYAVWHGYLSCTQPALKRAIDIFLSNDRNVDDAILTRLFKRHFCPKEAAQNLRLVVESGLEQLREAHQALQREDATAVEASDSLAEAIRLMRAILAGNHIVLHQLDEAQQRTDLLESFLHDATRDASTDALTGLSNRRAFDSALRTMAGEAMNHGGDLALVLLDIDHFKMVNDHWGHPIGDEVLRLVAGTLTRTVRGGDLVARHGGEEFAVILPHTGRRGALAVAENVREAVAARPYPITLEAGSPAESLAVTVSAGISCYRPGESLGHWLSRADAALYCAKHAGRNRVMFGSTSPAAGMVAPPEGSRPIEWHARQR